jgi:micrococcal nuclease
MKRLFSLFLLLIFWDTNAFAHPGRLDSNGGHYNRKTGEYHYHRGPNAGKSSASPKNEKPASSKAKHKSKKPAQKVEVASNSLYYVRVLRVVDGDTLEVAFSASQKEKVRMIGVDTPETVHPKKAVQRYGKEASEYTKKALTDKKIWLQMDVAPRDRYQRLLGYVWLEKPNDVDDEGEIRAKMFNARLLLEGYGQVMTIQPNSRYADIFVEFQKEAREAGKGLWGEE